MAKAFVKTSFSFVYSMICLNIGFWPESHCHYFLVIKFQLCLDLFICDMQIVEWQLYVVGCKVWWSHKQKNNRFFVFLVIWSTTMAEKNWNINLTLELSRRRCRNVCIEIQSCWIIISTRESTLYVIVVASDIVWNVRMMMELQVSNQSEGLC